jgi:hypothetical protein
MPCTFYLLRREHIVKGGTPRPANESYKETEGSYKEAGTRQNHAHSVGEETIALQKAHCFFSRIH